MRYIFFVSDGTGISVETIGKSLLTQFEGIEFKILTYRYVDTLEKAKNLAEQINVQSHTQKLPPIIFSTIADKPIRNTIKLANVCVIDFFEHAIPALEAELAQKATGTMGLSHAIVNTDNYNLRMDAVNFALNYDDGTSLRGYPSADIILTGVSRSGKTPTCLYLAMQFGINAANYPITEEDFEKQSLPEILKPYKQQLFGLTISPQRLQDIRQKRKPDSRYASLQQCQYEILEVEKIFKKHQIPYLNSTHLSIEELSTQIMDTAKLLNKFA